MKLEEYLRSQFGYKIRPLYIKDKCEICGETNSLELHHVTQFSILLKETLNNLNLKYKTIEEYDKHELQLISELMLGKQINCEYLTLCAKCHNKMEVDADNSDYYKKYWIEKGMKREEYINNIIIPYLNNIIGERLYKEDQKELINILNITDDRNRLQKSPKLFNIYFETNKIPYVIINKQIRIKNNKRKTIWIVNKLIIDK